MLCVIRWFDSLRGRQETIGGQAVIYLITILLITLNLDRNYSNTMLRSRDNYQENQFVFITNGVGVGQGR